MTTKKDNYNIDFNLPITLQFFVKQGTPKVILLSKKHIDYLTDREYSDGEQEFIDNWAKRMKEDLGK